MPGVKPMKPIAETQVGNRVTDDYAYWQRMQELSVFQEPGNVLSLAFSPQQPYYLASTSSMRLGVFDTVHCEAIAMFTRFKSLVHGAAFRNDGGLLGVGTHEGFAHCYDVRKTSGTSRKAIRLFRAHQVPVNAVAFAKNSYTIMTMADDGSMAYWDLTDPRTQSSLWEIEKAHDDSIRTGQFMELNDNYFITGSYDHRIKVWDMRVTPPTVAYVIDHGAPVEKILVSTNDKFLFSAGGLVVKIWDLSCGGRFVHALENHHKTVTSLTFATNGTRLVTGGLDRRVNVFSLDSGDYRLIYSTKVANSVLALSISPDDECMAVGMGNLLSIYRRKPKIDGLTRNLITTERVTSIPLMKQLMIGNPNVKKKMGAPVVQRERGSTPKLVEPTAPKLDKIRLGRLDMLLRKGALRQMLDKMFVDKNRLEKPEIVVAAFEQIRLRSALPRVLAGRSPQSLIRIITFLKLHMFKNNYFHTLSEVADVLMTIYAEETNPQHVVQHFRSLQRAIEIELRLQKSIAKANGSLDLLVQVSIANQREAREKEIDSIFGEVYIHPIPFRMDETTTALNEEDEINEEGEGDKEMASEEEKIEEPKRRSSRNTPAKKAKYESKGKRKVVKD